MANMWTIYSELNVTPKVLTCPLNIFAHNYKSQICYWVQISLQRAAVNCTFSDNLTPFGGSIYIAGDGTHKIFLNWQIFLLDSHIWYFFLNFKDFIQILITGIELCILHFCYLCDINKYFIVKLNDIQNLN